jgi:hypothetical protein
MNRFFQQLKRHYFWGITVVCLGLLMFGSMSHLSARLGVEEAIAQPAPPTESPIPDSPDSPSPIPTLPDSPTPSPTSTSPTPTPTRTPEVLPPPPLPSAPPLPISSDYQDPAGRFRVGILQGFQVSPLAGSILVEAPDGSLSYTIVVQTQVFTNLVGNDLILVNSTLEQVAQTVFQRGEGFQPGIAQPAAPEGIRLDWTGTLTIAGNPQPIGGVILARRSGSDALLLLIAATEAGSAQVPGAIAALSSSLQAL